MENKTNFGTSTTEMVTISRAEYDADKAYIAELEQQVQWLMEQMKLLKRKQFGAASEKATDEVMEQMSLLFDEAEAYVYTEQKAETAVKAHTRKKHSGSIHDVVPKDISVEEIIHGLPEDQRQCPQCGEEMTVIGTEVHESLKIKPAEAILQRDIYYTYACKNCEQNDISTPVVKTPKEPTIIPGSFASPEAVAHIMTQKYVMHSPLYRLEQEFNREGLKLTRQTMANWLLNASDTWLRPIYDVLHMELCRETVLHGDETTLQVLKESGKAATSKSYMWLYRTSGCAERPIVLYEYQPSRKAAHAEEFLSRFSGWLHADGYQGYHRLPGNIRVVGCWAHARRKFDEALQTLPKEERKASLAATGECYCTRLFRLEESFAN